MSVHIYSGRLAFSSRLWDPAPVQVPVGSKNVSQSFVASKTLRVWTLASISVIRGKGGTEKKRAARLQQDMVQPPGAGCGQESRLGVDG